MPGAKGVGGGEIGWARFAPLAWVRCDGRRSISLPAEAQPAAALSILPVQDGYYAGFLGGARITLLKSTETGRDGCEVWHLMIAEGKLFPAKPASAEPQSTNGRPAGKAQAASSRAKHDYARPAETAARGRGVSLSAEAQEIPF